MSTDDFKEKLKAYELAIIRLKGRQATTAADPLNELVISDMDTPGRESEGLGWNELSDPNRPVPMLSRLPEVVREGDEVKLFWTTTEPVTQPPQADPVEPAVQSYEIDAGTVERGWLSFAVKKGDLNLPPDASIPYPYYGYFYYSLYDQQADNMRYSEYRKVLIDLIVPGKPDQDSSSPINGNLFPANIVPNPIIGPPVPKVTVTIFAWIQMQIDDQVTLIWNGVRYVHPDRVTVVGQPVVFDVPTSVIEQGGSGPRIEVQYEIRDRVQNFSRLSPPAYVEADIDPNALLEPIVQGAESPPYELNLDPLGGADVTVSIPFYAGFASGDKVILNFIGLTADGVEVPYQSELRTVVTPNDLIFQVPYAFAAFVVKGTARVYYESTPAAGGAARRSRTRRISITGSVAELLPPEALEAVGDTIDLINVSGGLFHIRVPVYPGQMAGDVVTLNLTGQPIDGLPLVVQVEKTVPANGERDALVFDITDDYLHLMVDGTLTLSYTVFTPSLGITRRSTLDPTYNVVNSAAVDYPAPTCAQLQGSGADIFLPSDTQTAVFDIPNTAPLKPGNVVTLHFAAADGTPPEPVVPPKQFNGFPFNFSVTKEQIEPFVGENMSVTYSVDVSKG